LSFQRHKQHQLKNINTLAYPLTATEVSTMG